MDSDDDRLRPPTPPVDKTVLKIAIKSIATDADDDELFAELERDLENDAYSSGLRERRMEELKEEMAKLQDMREADHGQYTEVTDEKEVIKISANEPRCVIHFYHRDFRRCAIMDKHLAEIAPKHYTTRFLRVFVENVPWLVEKLAVKVLPCVICFVRGVTKDRIVGFEELGNSDGFKTSALEMRLTISGVIGSGKAGKVTPSRLRGADEGDSD